MKALSILALCSALLCGCKTSSPISHALFQQSVALAEGYALEQHPELVPDLRAATTVVCATANGTNASPDSIVAALNSANLTNATSRLIVNGGLALLNTVITAISPTNTSQVAAYSRDLCVGMLNGLPSSPAMAGLRRDRMSRLTSPHLLP